MNKYLETLSNLKDANKPVENNTELDTAYSRKFRGSW